MKRIMMIMIIIVLAVIPLTADDSENQEEDAYLLELAYQLRTRGWEDDEVIKLVEQARLMQWDSKAMGDPALVAFALHYGTHDIAQQPAERAMIRAQIAHQLALETKHMERLGYAVQSVAQQAAKGIRESLTKEQIQARQDAGEPVGTMVRQMVKNAVQQELAMQQKLGGTPAATMRQQATTRGNPSFASNKGSGNVPWNSNGPGR
ncbi:MAG: hypothetical protein PHP38_10865 [Sphaerochaetaceae bacterium]|jgi:hypothetical protein|nr:hypothetical protein [Sphaerochaetaceae bacterium]